MVAGFPQGLKPTSLRFETARLKPRPFKENLLQLTLVGCAVIPAKGYENEM